MSTLLSNTLILLAVFVSLSIGSVPAASQTPAARDLTEDEATAVLDYVFAGQPLTALAHLENYRAACQGEPLFLLMQARCYQERVPMDDANTSYGKKVSKPAIEALDQCIDVCSQRLKDDHADPKYYFYRGWAWMAKAYVRSMTRSLYKAGRDAGHGKKDLEHYLSMYPNDSTANGLLGSFLYFADTIPDAFKFLSKLLRMPSGDRIRGIQLLEAAIRSDGLLTTDWRLLLYNVYFYFEGRYEEGLAGLQKLNEEYPYYPRNAIPLAVSRLYAPRISAKNDAIVTETVNRLHDAPHQEVDQNALNLVEFFQACGDRYCSHSGATLAQLRSIIDYAPQHPDWVLSFARLELGRLYASRGDRRSARELFDTVKETSSIRDLRDQAKTYLEDMDKYANYVDRPAPQIDAWVTTLYEANPDSLAALENRFRRHSAGSLIAKFYLAETMLLAGDLENALGVYYEVIEVDAPAWDHTYQLIGSTRIAEIYAAHGRYESAAKFEAYAMNFYHGEYLIDWVIDGRQRYFTRLSTGEETVPPTLLTSLP